MKSSSLGLCTCSKLEPMLKSGQVVVLGGSWSLIWIRTLNPSVPSPMAAGMLSLTPWLSGRPRAAGMGCRVLGACILVLGPCRNTRFLQVAENRQLHARSTSAAQFCLLPDPRCLQGDANRKWRKSPELLPLGIWVAPSHCFLPFKPQGTASPQPGACISPVGRVKQVKRGSQTSWGVAHTGPGPGAMPAPSQDNPCRALGPHPIPPPIHGDPTAPCGTKLVLEVPEVEGYKGLGAFPAWQGPFPTAPLPLPTAPLPFPSCWPVCPSCWRTGRFAKASSQ